MVEQTFRNRRPSGANPRGRIVRRLRLAAEDGGATLALSGAGIIVTVRVDAESRRTFRRFCERAGVMADPVQAVAYSDGTFDRRTGAVTDRGRAAEPTPHVFQCVGPVGALRELAAHPAVAEWSFALGVRVPHRAGGSGEQSDRVRRAVRDARREAGERMAEVERAHRRPPGDQLRQAAAQLGADPDDAGAVACVAEVLRLAQKGEDSLTDAERGRVAALRRELGI